jgi:hypothetical protein
VMALDEDGTRPYTLASHGYAESGEGREFPHFPGSGKSCTGIHRLTDTSALVPIRLHLPANVARCGTRPAGSKGHSPYHGRNTALTQPTNGQRGPRISAVRPFLVQVDYFRVARDPTSDSV